jgi:hypothetical protein
MKLGLALPRDCLGHGVFLSLLIRRRTKPNWQPN